MSSNPFNLIAGVLKTILNASAIDPETKTALHQDIATVAQAGVGAVDVAVKTGTDAVAAAPTVAGALAGELTTEAVSKVPGGGEFASILGMIAQAAATLAVGHFVSSLETHNGDHIAAAASTLQKINASVGLSPEVGTVKTADAADPSASAQSAAAEGAV